jgi:hypothetical protein
LLPNLSRDEIILQPMHEIKKTKEDISKIKRMLRDNKRVNDNKLEDRIERVMSLLKESRNQWNVQQFTPSPPQPIYFPVPMPYPYAI